MSHEDRETAASVWPAVVHQLPRQPELPSERVPGVLRCRGCASARPGARGNQYDPPGLGGPSHLVPDVAGWRDLSENDRRPQLEGTGGTIWPRGFQTLNTVEPFLSMKSQAVKTNTESLNAFSAHPEPEELVAQSPRDPREPFKQCLSPAETGNRTEGGIVTPRGRCRARNGRAGQEGCSSGLSCYLRDATPSTVGNVGFQGRKGGSRGLR